MSIGPPLAPGDPPFVRTETNGGSDAKALWILDTVGDPTFPPSVWIRDAFPSERWNEWSVRILKDHVVHRLIMTLHEESFASSDLENERAEARSLVSLARRVLHAPVDHTNSSEIAGSIGTIHEAALMRRTVDQDLVEPFDVVWSGRTQLGPATMHVRTSFLDAMICTAVQDLPTGRIRAQIEEEDEFGTAMPTLRIGVESNILRIDRIDAMERLRIEREATIREGEVR